MFVHQSAGPCHDHSCLAEMAVIRANVLLTLLRVRGRGPDSQGGYMPGFGNPADFHWKPGLALWSQANCLSFMNCICVTWKTCWPSVNRVLLSTYCMPGTESDLEISGWKRQAELSIALMGLFSLSFRIVVRFKWSSAYKRAWHNDLKVIKQLLWNSYELTILQWVVIILTTGLLEQIASLFCIQY